MNGFDILLVVLLVAAAARGYYKGIIAMAAQVLGLVAGVVCCRLFASDVAARLGDGTTNVIAANVLVFVVAYLGCFFVGRLLHSLFRALHLSVVNRLCGSVFSALEMAVVLSLLMNLWQMLSPSSAPAAEATGGLRGFVYNVAPTLLGYLN